MPLHKIKKIIIAGSKSECQPFLKDLQYASIMQITRTKEPDRLQSENVSGCKSRVKPDSKEIEKVFKNFQSEMDEKTFLQKFFFKKLEVSRKNYEKIVKSFDYEAIISEISQLLEKISNLKKERENLLKDNQKILRWKDIDYPVREAGKTRFAEIFFGEVNRKSLKSLENLENLEISVIKHFKNKAFVLVVIHKSVSEEISKKIAFLGFEEVAFPGITCSPKEFYKKNLRKIKETSREISLCIKELKTLRREYKRLNTLLEYSLNKDTRRNVGNLTYRTEHTFALQGWIRAADMEKLDQIIAKYEFIVYEELSVAEGESVPISFTNPKIFSPFELITRLYSYPQYQSVDPSIITAIYFVIFFSITISDAGYGLVLTLISLLALKKIKGSRDILWIVFWGGLFTIFAGVLTGGFFGDLFKTQAPYFSLPGLGIYRENLIWFDPMRDPMVFFRLALALGIIQIISGLIIGLYYHLRQRSWMNALVENFSWLVILVSLLLILFSTKACVHMSLISGKAPPLDPMLIGPAIYSMITMSLVIILFSGRDEKSIFFRIFIGILRLFVLGGFFSYLGDVLSYIRLMALGMVTMGIAMAVNAIAFMVSGIPVLGLLLMIIILIFGHLFNMAINILGGFVHSIRLQYVEFFSKFFRGGGEKFEPFSNKEQYIKIIP